MSSTRFAADHFKALVASGEPQSFEQVGAVIHLFDWSCDCASLAAVFPRLARLEVESVSNGDLAVLAPFAELPLLRTLHMTVTGLARLSLGTWLHAASARPEIAIEIAVLARGRRAVLRIVHSGRVVLVENAEFTDYDFGRALVEVERGQLDRVELSTSPHLHVRWALQREARRIASKLVMPLIKSPSSDA